MAPRKKRPAGDGSIVQRGERSWRIEVSAGFDAATGKRKRVRRTVRGTERDARDALHALAREVMLGTDLEPGMVTVDDLLDRWLQFVDGRDRRPHTLRRYRQLARVHVSPVIGSVKLSKLRPAHVQQVLDKMAKGGSSSTTRHHAYRVMSMALRRAVRWQLMASNVADAIEPPPARRRQLVVPEPEALMRLLEVAAETPEHAAIAVDVATGLRRSELLGLRWRDVDLDGDSTVLRVREGLQRVPVAGGGSELVFDEPKTDRAKRTVWLPSFAVEALRRHRHEQNERRIGLGEGWGGERKRADDLVFDNGTGGPSDPDAFGKRMRRTMRQAGLDAKMRFHDLRHGNATALLVKGVHPAIVSAQLGHSDPSFTMRTYQHVLPTMGQQAADAVQDLLGGGPKVAPTDGYEQRS